MSNFILDQKFLVSSRRKGSLREVGSASVVDSQVTSQDPAPLLPSLGSGLRQAVAIKTSENTGQFPPGESPQGVARCAAVEVLHRLPPPRVLAGARPPLQAFFSTSSRFREESPEDQGTGVSPS